MYERPQDYRNKWRNSKKDSSEVDFDEVEPRNPRHFIWEAAISDNVVLTKQNHQKFKVSNTCETQQESRSAVKNPKEDAKVDSDEFGKNSRDLKVALKWKNTDDLKVALKFESRDRRNVKRSGENVQNDRSDVDI